MKPINPRHLKYYDFKLQTTDRGVRYLLHLVTTTEQRHQRNIGEINRSVFTLLRRLAETAEPDTTVQEIADLANVLLTRPSASKLICSALQKVIQLDDDELRVQSVRLEDDNIIMTIDIDPLAKPLEIIYPIAHIAPCRKITPVVESALSGLKNCNFSFIQSLPACAVESVDGFAFNELCEMADVDNIITGPHDLRDLTPHELDGLVSNSVNLFALRTMASVVSPETGSQFFYPIRTSRNTFYQKMEQILGTRASSNLFSDDAELELLNVIIASSYGVRKKEAKLTVKDNTVDVVICKGTMDIRFRMLISVDK